MRLPRAALDAILPFRLVLGEDGAVRDAGPSMLKVFGDRPLVGRAFFEAFSVRKPRRIGDIDALRARSGERLQLDVAALATGQGASPRLYGVAMPVGGSGLDGPDADPDADPHAERAARRAIPCAHRPADIRKGPLLLALTPGADISRYVEDHGLKASDFSPADGSAEMMYLANVQREMIRDSHALTERLMQAKSEAERLARNDALTGLPNRRALMERLRALLDAPGRGSVAVLHIDLDKFKEVNDTLGHAAGDEVLVHAAACMRSEARAGDFCARLGGDEFAMLFDSTTDAAGLQAISTRLIAAMSQPLRIEGKITRIGASIGIAVVEPGRACTPDALLHEADLALYEIKRGGRGAAMLCTPELRARHADLQAMSKEIETGLANGAFVPHFQPQVNVASGEVVGFEALARWRHPERGLLRPAEFMPVSDRAGLTPRIDAHLRREALGVFGLWLREGRAIPAISLNLTTDDLREPAFCDRLLWDLEEACVPPARVRLEMVESVLFDENAEHVTRGCEALTRAGFSLSIDDFGTGHASILSLVNLPVSCLKIDRAFVNGVGADGRLRTLARSMIGMAASLGLDVVGEGVEAAEDLAVMRELGCDVFQSYLFGRPMPAEDVPGWLVRQENAARAGGEARSA